MHEQSYKIFMRGHCLAREWGIVQELFLLIFLLLLILGNTYPTEGTLYICLKNVMCGINKDCCYLLISELTLPVLPNTLSLLLTAGFGTQCPPDTNTRISEKI